MSRVTVDPRQVAVSFRNDQVQTVNGARQPGFAPLSGFFAANDGWVRTHANYPHHRVRLLRALELDDGATREEAVAAIAGRRAQDIEDVVTADHGIAVRVRTVRGVDGHRTGRCGIRSRPAVRGEHRLGACRADARPAAGAGPDQGARRPGGDQDPRAARLRRAARRQPPPARARGAPPRHRRGQALDPGRPARRARPAPPARPAVRGRRAGDRLPSRRARGIRTGSCPPRRGAPAPRLRHADGLDAERAVGERRGFDSIVQAATGIALIESR